MNIELDLNKALDFAFFDKITQTFYIDQGVLTPEDVGTYTLTAYAHFANETYYEHFKTEFTL